MNNGFILQTENLSKCFGGIHAVKNLSIHVREGEILGLIGPNGSGKSTFVNLVAGVYKPDAGRVMFQGKDITALTAPELASLGICRTFQASRPFAGLSVLDNVTMGCLLRHDSIREARLRAMELIEITGLGEHAFSKSGSLPVEKRKRLDLCRALATRPKLLMLDEVMAGLNPSEMEQGLDLVRRINAMGITIIFIEHVIRAVLSLCSRVIVLNQGELLAEGLPREIVTNEVVIRAYLGEGYKHAGD